MGVVELKILYFAQAREITNISEEWIHIEGADERDLTTQNLIQKLLDKYPKLKDIMNTLVLAVNMSYINKNQKVQLKDKDEVALIPPIGGG